MFLVGAGRGSRELNDGGVVLQEAGDYRNSGGWTWQPETLVVLIRGPDGCWSSRRLGLEGKLPRSAKDEQVGMRHPSRKPCTAPALALDSSIQRS